MSAISLNSHSCVRSILKNSTCTKCEDVCPVDAINISDEIGKIRLPSLNLNRCIGCGGCVSICPSSALKLDEFKSTEFFFSFLDDKVSLISCQKNVPCIAALSVEDLISLSILKDEVVLDVGHCDNCEIAHKCRDQIDNTYEEASYILDAMNYTHNLKVESLGFINDDVENNSTRRDFFNTFTLKNAIKTKSNFDTTVQMATDEFIEHKLSSEDIKLIRLKSELSDRKKLFFTALKRVEKPSEFHVIDANELSFTSLKLIDSERCTACQMCYRICPSKALRSDNRNSKIDFDSYLCINCNSCIDVCEVEAISSSPSFNMKDFFVPSIKRLITFDVKKCENCGNFFTPIGGVKSCNRCMIEDDHARDLWGLNI